MTIDQGKRLFIQIRKDGLLDGRVCLRDELMPLNLAHSNNLQQRCRKYTYLRRYTLRYSHNNPHQFMRSMNAIVTIILGIENFPET